MADARFEDGRDTPLRLKAEDADDVQVLSTLLQDAVIPSSEISWMPRRHRLMALVNRFRWEDRQAAQAEARAYERVQSVLRIDGVMRLRASGIDPTDRDLIFSLLDISFSPGEDGGGVLSLHLAGDGTIAADVECIDLSLSDVSRPYAAPSGRAPDHKLD